MSPVSNPSTPSQPAPSLLLAQGSLLSSPEHPVQPSAPRLTGTKPRELLIPAATSVLWPRHQSHFCGCFPASSKTSVSRDGGKETQQPLCAPQHSSRPTQGSLFVVTCSHLGVSSAPQSAAMARGTGSRTPLFPHMALIHAAEPRVLFSWFSSFLPLSSGELSPSHYVCTHRDPRHGQAALGVPCAG